MTAASGLMVWPALVSDGGVSSEKGVLGHLRCKALFG